MWLKKFPKAWARLSCAFVLVSAAYIATNTAIAAMHPEQNPDTMLPEQRVAKAREILNQLTEALGGPAYLEVRERECDGRRAQFGHAGELMGFIDFKDYWRYPDKHRTDYSKRAISSTLLTAIRAGPWIAPASVKSLPKRSPISQRR